MTTALAGRVFRELRTRGAAGTGLAILRRVAAATFATNSAFWYERSLEDDLPTVEAGVPLEVGFDGASETVRWLLVSGEPWMRDRREIETGRRFGHMYPWVKTDGRIVGYIKIGVGRVYVGDYRMTLPVPPEAVFIYDTYVDPSFRGRRIASALVSAVMRELQLRGYRRIGCHIPPWNTASAGTYRKLGFVRGRYVRHLRICGLRLFSGRPSLFDGRPGGCECRTAKGSAR